MNSITITLPLPAKELSPNARVHWKKLMGFNKAARERAWAETKVTLGRWRQPLWDKATIQATFYYKTAAYHDDDNSIGSIKAYRDGIADAGIVKNDKDFKSLPPIMLKDKVKPRVEITITEIAE